MEYLTHQKFIDSSLAPQILYDGNTLGWFQYDVSIIKTDSSVAIWGDLSGTGHNLNASTNNGSTYPTWTNNGIYFDGSDDFLMSNFFIFPQPCYVYMVVNPSTWINNSYLFDGITWGSDMIYQSPNPNNIRIQSNTISGAISLPNGSVSIVRALFNGPQSKVAVNQVSLSASNLGTYAPNGFTIGAHAGNGNNSNITIKELIIRKKQDWPIHEQQIYDYLNTKYFGGSAKFLQTNGRSFIENSNIKNPLYDGNTVVWYDSTDLSTLTLTTDSSVLLWKDKLNSGIDLSIGTMTARPQWTNDGIVFDGIDDQLKTKTITINQPTSIYVVVNQLSWSIGKKILSGNTNGWVTLEQTNVANRINLQSGVSLTSPYTDLSLNTWGIIRGVYNGPTSSIQLNNKTKLIGNAGTEIYNAGISVGSFVTGGNHANFKVKEIIFRKVKDFPQTEQYIYNYLNTKYFGATVLNPSINTSYLKIDASYYNPLYDGNTVAWYDCTDTSTLTLTVDSSVSRWNDKLGSGRDLIQNTGDDQPKYLADGILFGTGSSNVMTTSALTINEPIIVYVVFKQLSYTLYDTIVSGTGNFCNLRQYSGPNGIGFYSGDGDWYSLGLPLGQFGIVRVVYNYERSKLQINNTAQVNGKANRIMQGIQVGPANIQVKEVIVRQGYEWPQKEQYIYNYLKTKYSL